MNGKGEWARWLVGLVLAAVVAYFTAQSTVQVRLGVLEDRYARIVDDIREIKADVKEIVRAFRP